MDNTPVQSDEISLKDLIQKIREGYDYLRSQWKVILLAGIIGSCLGLVYSYIKKPIYTATLSFALEDEKSGGGLGSALGLASTLGMDIGGGSGGAFTGPNLIELFKSRSMVEQTLLNSVTVSGKNISLAEMYIKDNDWDKNWKKDPKLAKIKFLPDANRKNFTRVHDSILGFMYKSLLNGGLKVDQKDKSISIISIEVYSTDELFAKYFCDALAKEVSDFYVYTKSKKARMNMAILEKQTDSIRRELNGAITGVAIANDNTFNLNPALNVRRAPSARRQVDVQANTAILTELVKQTELAKVSLRKETPLIQIIDRPILPLAKERFGKSKGIIFGGILAGFLTIFVLLAKRLFTSIMQ